ncbi:MAG TPA: glycosyltransferase family 39 protein [Aggregatilineales bacterium]|nr:glycosyltransferase family 39 protein [Aggregatilineales bacterium]
MVLHTRAMAQRYGWTVVVILLLLQLFLRTVHVTAQGVFVDEAFHTMVGTTVWHPGADPISFQEGKTLVYYYFGLFLAGSTTALFISRTAIALFSLVSGAVVYQLGCTFHSHAAGIVALIIYAILPFTFFYERMALADPLAAGFGCLVAWRSLAFARHPRWRDGVILGLLLALATLAKLTNGLFPLLPVITSIIYFPVLSWTPRQRVVWWLRRYFPPLALAAAVMIGCWLPVVIQIMAIHGRLVAAMNVATDTPFDIPGLLAYIAAMLHDTAEYTSPAFFAAVALASFYLLFNKKSVQAGFFLIFWLAISTLLIFAAATLVASRYLLSGAAPLIVILAVAVTDVWQRAGRLPARAALGVMAAGWLVVFVVPFLYTAITKPTNLPLTGQNYAYYIGGTLNADETTIQAARVLDNADPLIKPDPSVKVVYGDVLVCRLIYSYMQRPVTCLAGSISRQIMAADLAPGESAYLVMYDAGAGLKGIDGVCSNPFVRFAHVRSYSIDIWRLHLAPCSADQK